MTYINSIERKGIKKGLEQGRIEGLRSALLIVLEQRFGDVPTELESLVGAMQDQAKLLNLTGEATRTESLEQFLGILSR